jgi:hypothetical protein
VPRTHWRQRGMVRSGVQQQQQKAESTALKLQLVGMHDASCCVSLRKARLPTGASGTELPPAGTSLSGPSTAGLKNGG